MAFLDTMRLWSSQLASRVLRWQSTTCLTVAETSVDDRDWPRPLQRPEPEASGDGPAVRCSGWVTGNAVCGKSLCVGGEGGGGGVWVSVSVLLGQQVRLLPGGTRSSRVTCPRRRRRPGSGPSGAERTTWPA